ncbi:MAG: DUF4091 domain-containing protein [Clostridia bacterium]|nr:DUF4091 domain-containing protein [Clostridia bacterium]
MAGNIQLRQVSSLAKVFPEKIFSGNICNSLQGARGQELSYQIAYRYNAPPFAFQKYRVEVSTPWEAETKVYSVGLVPTVLPCYPGKYDDDYISHKSGIFPDPLIPLKSMVITARTGVWQSIWISVNIPEDAPAGEYFLTVTFRSEEGDVRRRRIRLLVHPCSLPAQDLIFTQWFHCDCIADAHGVPVLSEAHWDLIEKYMKMASSGGINMILTPVLTPPLDTAIGGERPTVQLVEIEKKGTEYSFDFSKLGRYVEIARRVGMEYLEINHFFTQWGAAHAPKVIAKENGEDRRIFGWDTDANGEDYRNFLSQLLPALLSYLDSIGVDRSRIYFHISDEPRAHHLEAYKAVATWFRPLLQGCMQIDALSNIDFYKNGILEHPVVNTDRIQPFLDAGVPDLWCYNCCSQSVGVSNRFLAMPSYRNRILGVQMYKHNMRGFLHWGYNFFYNRLSEGQIDPYKVTDAGIGFPGGDSFSVYPGDNDANPSLRLKVFAQGIVDMRLLKLVENKLGRERVIAELDRICECDLSFSCYPKTDAVYDKLYDFIFSNI